MPIAEVRRIPAESAPAYFPDPPFAFPEGLVPETTEATAVSVGLQGTCPGIKKL